MDVTIKKLLVFFEENQDLCIFSMNGSRVDKNRRTDQFQDYDVVFFTDSIEKYKFNDSFLRKFGEILLVTEPDGVGNNGELMYPKQDGYTYLVQYKSGLRIDFQLMKLSRFEDYLKSDSLTKIIASKEATYKIEIEPVDSNYWLGEVLEPEIEYSIKEFYWQLLNALKANLRGEFLLAQFYLNLVRDEMMEAASWHIANKYGFDKNYGKKNDKVLALLDEKLAQKITQTFDTSSAEKVNLSLKLLMELENEFLPELSQKYSHIPKDYLLSKGEGELADFYQL